MTWKEYKKLIIPTITDHGEQHLIVLALGIASKIGELIKLDFSQFKENKSDNTDRTMEIGDILWYIAALECTYNLPDNIYSEFFDLLIDPSEVDLYATVIEIQESITELLKDMRLGDRQDIQYELNSLTCAMLDYADFNQLTISECMNASLLKLKLRKENGKKQPTIEYNAVRKMTKEQGRQELIIEAKFVNKQYKSLSVSYKGEVKSFNSRDIIIDNFYATEYINNNFKGTGYMMNFGPSIRSFFKEQNSIINGFILGDSLIPSSDIRRNGNNSVQGARSTIYSSDMTTLNQLLDYINENKIKHA